MGEIKDTIISSLAFPTAITGFGALSSIKRNKGIKNAIQATRSAEFRTFNTALKKGGIDIFTRGAICVEKYEKYKELAKKASKGKLTLGQKFLNLFKKEGNKLTEEAVKSSADAAKNSANGFIGGLANEAKTITETAAKSGFKSNVKNLFKKEAKSKMTWVFTAIEAIPEIKDKIIPAFKNEGFGAGMKQVGKSTLKLGSSFLSFTLGGSLGRVIGSAIGTAICPGVGSTIGAAIGSMFGMGVTGKVADKAVQKITGEKEEVPQAEVQEAAPTEAQETVAQAPISNAQASEYDPGLARIEEKVRKLNIAV